MVEIGPGLGALTRPLCERRRRACTSIEIDRDIVARLRAEFPAAARRRSTRAMRSTFDFGALGARPARRRQPALQHLHAAPVSPRAATRAAIRDIHVMLQKEVVERMVAAPVALRLRAALGDAAVPLRDGARARGAGRARSGRRPRSSPRVVRMTPHRPLPHPRARRERSSPPSSRPRSRSAARRCATR